MALPLALAARLDQPESSSSPWHRLLSNGAAKTFAPKQQIFYDGDARFCIYKVESGSVCLHKALSDGRRQIVDFAFPGDVIGLGASNIHSYGAQALERAVLRSTPVSTLYRFAHQDADLAMALFEALSFELEAAQGLILALGRASAIERVATFLLRLSQRNTRTGRNPRLLKIPMCRSDIGDLLGMTVETVSRSLTKLKQQRRIEIIAGSTIQIIDLEGLNEMVVAASLRD